MQISWYGHSKREGELAVAESWKGGWTVLRPGVIYGAGDRGLFVYFRMAADARVSGGRTMPRYGSRRKCAAV